MTSQPDDKVPSPGKSDSANGGDQIAHSLKRVYQDVADEPLPDRLVELLEKLKKGESE